MTSNLLAATDFSAPARHAVERAALIARSCPDARLTLAHVLQASLFDRLRLLTVDESSELEARIRQDAQRQLDEAARNLGARFGIAIESTVEYGTPLEILPRLLTGHDASLLVMGTRGAHFVRELLIGSTTERVLRTSQQPVLAVKQRPQSAYRRILAAVDFSAHAATAIRLAHAWFPDAEFVLLHAFEVEHEPTYRLAGLSEERIHAYRARAREAATLQMNEFIAMLGLPPAKVVREFAHGAPTQRIVEYEQVLDADLIVMGKRGQTLVEQLLLGSVVQHVLNYASCDVFVASQT